MSSLREEFVAAHPDFPLLSVTDPEMIHTVLMELGWYLVDEELVNVSYAGVGNMNLTLRVKTNLRSFILKQARPWVEKYDHIPAPWERSDIELQFYTRTSVIGAVASRMPKMIHFSMSYHLLMLEDLWDAEDFGFVYSGKLIEADHVVSLAEYLATLHGDTYGRPGKWCANRKMRQLNHQHIFEIPFQSDNGLDFNEYEPELNEIAKNICVDAQLVSEIKLLGELYLSDGPCLLHGDFYPGSWMCTKQGIKVIDPEFCFNGPCEYDLGTCFAHMLLAKQNLNIMVRFITCYRRISRAYRDEGARLWDEALIVKFMGVEIIRRLIGVAQLPIPPTTGFRKELIEKARRMILNPTFANVFML
jgi:5-methylthioribose kinase